MPLNQLHSKPILLVPIICYLIIYKIKNPNTKCVLTVLILYNLPQCNSNFYGSYKMEYAIDINFVIANQALNNGQHLNVSDRAVN